MQEGPSRRLIGFVLDEKGIPRHGYSVRTPEGEGEVTSGNLSPILDIRHWARLCLTTTGPG